MFHSAYYEVLLSVHLCTSDIHNKRQYEELSVAKSKFGPLICYSYHWTAGQTVCQRILRQDAERGKDCSLKQLTERFQDNIVSSKITRFLRL